MAVVFGQNDTLLRLPLACISEVYAPKTVGYWLIVARSLRSLLASNSIRPDLQLSLELQRITPNEFRSMGAFCFQVNQFHSSEYSEMISIKLNAELKDLPEVLEHRALSNRELIGFRLCKAWLNESDMTPMAACRVCESDDHKF